MKTTLKFTIMSLMVLGTLVTKANEITLDFVTKNTEKSIVFNLAQVSKHTSIQFLDSDRNIIYSGDVLQYNSLRKKFDLSKLESGTYTLNVEDTIKIMTYVIVIDESKITVVSKNEVIKPAFRVKEDVVFMNLMNSNKEDVTVMVFDQENRVLHTEKILDQLIVEKAINFKKAFKGNYSIVVKTTQGNFQKNITI
jgi:hypothetical protein